MRTVVVLATLGVVGLTGSVLASPSPVAGASPPPPPPPQAKTFARDVAPVLDHWCVPCHDGDEPHGDLRLDSFEGIMRGGETGPAVVAGDPMGSLLVAKIERRHRPSMPPRRRFPAPLVAIVRAWIAGGALP